MFIRKSHHTPHSHNKSWFWDMSHCLMHRNTGDDRVAGNYLCHQVIIIIPC